ncbi:MAG: AI-2E family transporter [Chitinophagaceae bacterium]
MSHFDNDRLKQTLFLMVITLLGVLLFWQLSGFLSGFLGAITLFILLRPVLYYLTEKKKFKKGWTTVLLMILSFVILLLPLSWVGNLMFGKLSEVLKNPAGLMVPVNVMEFKINSLLHIDLHSSQFVQKIQEIGSGILSTLVNATFSSFANIAIMYFTLYFMLMNARDLEKMLFKMAPLRHENTQLLSVEIKNAVISNTLGIPLVAVAQGMASALGYWIFGVKDPLFWGVLTGFFSIIPVVGSAAMWIPLGLYLLAIGMKWQGISLLIYCTVVITAIDNGLRSSILNRLANVHPMITIFGIIIGVNLFGIVGLIFGPLLISLFLLFLKIYKNEYVDPDKTTPKNKPVPH